LCVVYWTGNIFSEWSRSMSQKATAEAKSNIAFIKWAIGKHLAHYID
jgi:hypothetical protein